MIEYGYYSDGLANMKKGRAGVILKESARAMGEYWHDVIYPIRFEGRGKARYHLKQRTQKYKRFVRKFLPNWRPLVATGLLKETSMNNVKVTAKNSQGNVSVKISMKRGHPTKRYVSEELTKILKKESKELMRVFKTTLEELIKAEPSESFKNGKTRKGNRGGTPKIPNRRAA